VLRSSLLSEVALMFKSPKYSWMLVVIGIILPPCLSAADPSESSWENLRQLRSGHEIQVVEMGLGSQEGKFLGLSEQAISFRVQDREVSVRREEVLRVSLRGGHPRLRNLLLGMLAGGGVGLAVGAGQDGKYNCADPSNDYCYHKFAGGVIGLGIGAAAGALLPARPRTLYRATSPRRDVK
jgi:hypothetical protein